MLLFYYLWCRPSVFSFGSFPVLPFYRPIPSFYADIPDFYTKIPCYSFSTCLTTCAVREWEVSGVRGGSLGDAEAFLASYTFLGWQVI